MLYTSVYTSAMRIRASALLLAVCLLLTLHTFCQQTTNLTQIARIDLGEHPDSFRLFSGSDEDHGRRAPLFVVSMTPDGDLVAFIAMQSGPWHLVRVKDWSAQKPVVERLNVPGYGADESSDKFSITPQVLITRNGKYLVTVAHAPWPRENDDIINVIDLQTFHLVATARLQQGFTGDWRLGPGDSLLANGVVSDTAKPLGSEQRLALLSLPSLSLLDRCDYSVGFNPPNSISVERAELHGTPSTMCAREVQNQLAHQNESQETHVQLDPTCGIEETTPDHHYAVGTCRECRQTLFGVSCKSEKSEIYAVGSNRTIGSLIHAPHKLSRVTIAQSNGKLYLLSLEDANKLTVYLIQAVP